MKKMCFSEKYGLHDAVIAGWKTHTRRLIPQSILDKVDAFQSLYYDATLDRLDGTALLEQYFIVEAVDKLPLNVGDVVAIAERYKDVGIKSIPEENDEFGCYDFPAEQTKGWDNKMFVRADLMPHQIRIKRMWFERLQDISDEDCINEGIIATNSNGHFSFNNAPRWYLSAREAYATLIDLISGKGTWASNPYVFAYEFELVK